MTKQRERLLIDLRDMRNDDVFCMAVTPWVLEKIDLAIEEISALPSEGNRERSERTADGAIGREIWVYEAIPYGCGAGHGGCTAFWAHTKPFETGTLYREVLASPPASASMSAGVTDEDLNMLHSVAEYMRKNGESPQCARDLEQLRSKLSARANTRAGVEK